MSEPCYLIIKANIHVRAVYAPGDNSPSAFGHLAIGYEYDDGGGAVKTLSYGTMGSMHDFCQNSYNSDNNKHGREHVDIPLLLVLDHTTANIGRIYNFFQVYGCVSTPDGDLQSILKWRYSSISLLALRA